MNTENNSIDSEEVIFYLDLVTDFLDKAILVKSIREFISIKSEFGDTSYGVVLFQNEDNPINVYGKSDAMSIIDIIEEAWDSREAQQSCLENGLFEILSYIFAKVREGSKTYRIIIISDTPSERSEEYHDAVYGLIVKAKSFSTFIDIIRVGTEEYYSDDIKLKVLTSETQGGAFYINDSSRFEEILCSLVKNKKGFNIIKGDKEDTVIMSDDKIFYERLAADLISLDSDEEEICNICEAELCPICGAYSDEIHKCYNCGAKFHGCCVAHYSIANNIGFRHIFRCPQCESLLKLDEDYVNIIFSEEFEGETDQSLPEEQDVEEVVESSGGKYDYDSFDEDEETVTEEEIVVVEDVVVEEEPVEPIMESVAEEEPEIVVEEPIETTADPKDVPPPPAPPEPMRKVKVGGFFGREIEVKDKRQPGSLKQPALKVKEIESSPSITALKPPRKKKASMKFCKICGASVVNAVTCSTCGAKVD